MSATKAVKMPEPEKATVVSHCRRVLARLMETPGVVVTQADLKAAGWPGRDLSQDQTIVGGAAYLLRIAGHKIETVKNVGYIWHQGPEPKPPATEADSEQGLQGRHAPAAAESEE